MSASDSYSEFLLELLESMGPVRIKRMFGGAGLFLDEVMFGLIAQDVLYFKVDDVNRPAFEAEDCEPFTYDRKDKAAIVMSYARAPERLFDEPDEFVAWARDAFAAAKRNAKPKKPARKKKAAKSKKSRAKKKAGG